VWYWVHMWFSRSTIYGPNKSFPWLHRIRSLSCYNEVGISHVQQKIISSEDAALPGLPSHPGELLQTIVGWRKYFLLGSRFTCGSERRVCKPGQSDECIWESRRYFKVHSSSSLHCILWKVVLRPTFTWLWGMCTFPLDPGNKFLRKSHS
jgi:hypothetical protein